MKREQALIFLAVVATAQLAVPAKMILERERTLARGDVFKFRTAPVDPYDAFRGRYVTLRLDVETETVPWRPDAGRDIRPKNRVYVELGVDADGFARLLSASQARPGDADGRYIEARLMSTDRGQARIDLPLDRYYLPEDIAPRAERAYLAHSRRGQRDAFISVRVYEGMAVIEDLYVAGLPIRDYLDADPP